MRFLQAMFLTAGILASLTLCSHVENNYTRSGMVSGYSERGVFVCDSNGYEWDVETHRDLSIGSKVTLCMYTNGTSDSLDDIVRNLRV